MKVYLVIILTLLTLVADAQQPKYTRKRFVVDHDTSLFRPTKVHNGPFITYIPTSIVLWDVDDDHTTIIRGSVDCLLYITGTNKNGKREGVVTMYVIDSLDNKKKYKISEQEYVNDKLNGQWRTYGLHGKLFRFDTFKDDSLRGVSRKFWIDGQKIMEEEETLGHGISIMREYYDDNQLKFEAMYKDEMPNGPARKFYPNGVVQEEVTLRNGEFNGERKYFHPSGKLWIHEVYRDGKHWEILGNFDSQGRPREKGTLKNGNGTIYFYNDDGSVREIVTIVNGIEKNN